MYKRRFKVFPRFQINNLSKMYYSYSFPIHQVQVQMTLRINYQTIHSAKRKKIKITISFENEIKYFFIARVKHLRIQSFLFLVAI